ncbi:hypothetical protein HYALB_00002739 [Hymenoscyphus albidus]|uniref:Uncharacterized protein n=1 Tax=Hymenoscyphus albidus TaxID=595503 RepID=A0A9N9M559_9HELO|nr:hypothetical protein HYALB_00002739 [Hymenoscyphus albidus]
MPTLQINASHSGRDRKWAGKMLTSSHATENHSSNNMCKATIITDVILCGHTIDAAPSLVPDGCGGCGTATSTVHMASSKRKTPCEDCKADGKWVQQNGKWVKA